MPFPTLLLALIQAAPATTAAEPSLWPSLAVGGPITGLVLALWKIDRKESGDRFAQLAKDSQERYADLAKESQERYCELAKESNQRASEIAEDFRNIVTENTKAMVTLAEKITNGDAVTVRLLVEALRKNKVLNVEP